MRVILFLLLAFNLQAQRQVIILDWPQCKINVSFNNEFRVDTELDLGQSIFSGISMNPHFGINKSKLGLELKGRVLMMDGTEEACQCQYQEPISKFDLALTPFVEANIIDQLYFRLELRQLEYLRMKFGWESKWKKSGRINGSWFAQVGHEDFERFLINVGLKFKFESKR